MTDAFLDKLAGIVGHDNVDAAPDPPVFRPGSEESLAALVRACHTERRGICIEGGGTQPGPSADPGLVRLSTRGLGGVREVLPADTLTVAGAGETVGTVTGESARAGLMPSMHLPVPDHATIGGTFMGGAFCQGTDSDGTLRRTVIGLRAVTACGEMVTFGGRTVKNVTGFELPRFLAGTNGMFCIATELILKGSAVSEFTGLVHLAAEPGAGAGLLDIPEALDAAARAVLMAPGGIAGPSTLDLVFEGFAPLARAAMGRVAGAYGDSPGITESEGNADDFSRGHAELARDLSAPGLQVVTVPPRALGALLDRLARIAPDVPLAAYPAYGRLHVRGLSDEALAALSRASRTLGGRPPAAWGAEEDAGAALTPGERALARSLKRELDPLGILNPHRGLR